jgi:hypothetical protein
MAHTKQVRVRVMLNAPVLHWEGYGSNLAGNTGHIKAFHGTL